MTETLTYDPTPADTPELNADEQKSLEVAEKLGEEEAKQYAGKFQNAEDLENAYLELQKKLGDKDDDTETTTKAEDEAPEEVSPGVSLITDAANEYYANDRQLSEDTMKKFGEMSSQDLVSAFMQVQKDSPFPNSEVDLTDAEMNTIYNSAGGEQAYNDITSWAAQNASESQLDAFNQIIDNGNVTAIQIALNGLKADYEAANGYEGRMLTGKAPRTSEAFRSQAEVVQAMTDPRYERDPAYRQDVYDKLERSNVQF